MDSPALDSRGRHAARAGGLILVLLLVSAGISSGREKEFGGVGLQVVPIVSGELVVLNVVDGAPAADAGLLPGDLIVQVDDLPLKGSDFTEIVSGYLWGEAGTSVTLKYLRPGKEGHRSVTLRRIPLNPEQEGPAGVRMLTPGER